MRVSRILFSAMITASTLLASAAHAGRKDSMPLPIEKFDNSKIISIHELEPSTKRLVDRTLLRSDFGDPMVAQLEPIAAVRGGEVLYRDRNEVKTLSEDALKDLAASRICDLNIFGECLIFDKRSGSDIQIFALGSQLHADGTVTFVEGIVNKRLAYGTSANVLAMAERLIKQTNGKRLIFTRATEHF